MRAHPKGRALLCQVRSWTVGSYAQPGAPILLLGYQNSACRSSPASALIPILVVLVAGHFHRFLSIRCLREHAIVRPRLRINLSNVSEDHVSEMDIDGQTQMLRA